jgi:hypothetical protein
VLLLPRVFFTLAGAGDVSLITPLSNDLYGIGFGPDLLLLLLHHFVRPRGRRGGGGGGGGGRKGEEEKRRKVNKVCKLCGIAFIGQTMQQQFQRPLRSLLVISLVYGEASAVRGAGAVAGAGVCAAAPSSCGVAC